MSSIITGIRAVKSAALETPLAKKLNECSIFPPCRLEQSVVERVRLIVVPESSELAVVTIPAPVGVMMEDIPSNPAFTPTHTTSLRKRPQETSATLEERVLCDAFLR